MSTLHNLYPTGWLPCYNTVLIGIQTGHLLNCVRWPLYALSDARTWHALSWVTERDLTGPSAWRKRVTWKYLLRVWPLYAALPVLSLYSIEWKWLINQDGCGRRGPSPILIYQAKRSKREAYHLPVPNVEDYNLWNFAPTPLYISRARCSSIRETLPLSCIPYSFPTNDFTQCFHLSHCLFYFM